VVPMESPESKYLLELIVEQLRLLSQKIDTLIDLQQPRLGNPDLGTMLDASLMMELPDHLRKTAIILTKLSRATAEDIARISKRARAVESAYLNSLCLMGWVKKERKGRKAFFWIEYEKKP
jgi:hypothetical protein